MTTNWILSLGTVRGMNIPESIISDECRLRGLLGKHCRGPYDKDGIQIGLALYVEGSGLQLDHRGIRLEPLRKKDVGACIYVHKSDWDTSPSSYRSFLWQSVEQAILGCIETLKKRQISVDVDRLRRDLSLVEGEFLEGSLELKSGSKALEHAATHEELPCAGLPDDEMDRIVIQYRVEGHGNGRDHDKRVAVENLLEGCLSEGKFGNCDGGDIGSGTMNIFCFVSDAQKARGPIIRTLRGSGHLDGAVIQQSVKGEERVVWPPDFAGEFTI